MDYLTNYYKNLCEQLQEQLNNLQNLLNEEGDMRRDAEDAEDAEDAKMLSRYVHDDDENFVGPPKRFNYDVLSDDEIKYRTKRMEQYTKLKHRNKQIADTWGYVDKDNIDPITLSKIKDEFLKEIDKNKKQSEKFHHEIWKMGKNRNEIDPRIPNINERINKQATDSEEKPIS